MNQFFMPYINPMFMPNYMPFSRSNARPGLATAYIPMQPFVGILPLDKALEVGTLFPNMYEIFPSLFNAYSDEYERMEEIE